MPNEYYLSLGSNIRPKENLLKAIENLKDFGEVNAISSMWQTAAVGNPGPKFLNAVVHFIGEYEPDELKNGVLRKIEIGLGRVRGIDKFAPRTIDIDILVFNNQTIDRLIWEHAHLAVPLAEIFPSYQNPDGEEIIKDTARRLKVESHIELFDNLDKLI